MSHKWIEQPLGKIITLKRGYDLPKRDRAEGLYPIVSSSGVSGYHNKAMVKAPGVVTGRYGTLGQVFYIEDDFWPLNTSLYVQKFNGNDPRFISYFLGTLQLGSQNVAGAVPGVNRNALHKLKVRIPPLPIQKKITAVLSAYDDLIENNNKRIALLEKAAEEIYREWFVRLRFPGWETVVFHKGIPDGWEPAKIKQITSKIGSGSTPKGGKEAYLESGISLIRSLNVYDFKFTLKGLAFIDEQQASKLAHVKVRPNDVLLNITGASVARCCMVPSHILPAHVNQHVAIIRANDQTSPFYILHSLNSSGGKQQLLAIAQTGATREALTKTDVETFQILHPTKDLLRQFTAIVQPMYEQGELLQNQTRILKQTRDLLLSRLISGKLPVDDLDIQFPPSMMASQEPAHA